MSATIVKRGVPSPPVVNDGDGEEDFCGCCGDVSDGPEWCSECLPHVEQSGRAPWDRAYFGWSGRSCPFQVTPPDSLSEPGLVLEEPKK